MKTICIRPMVNYIFMFQVLVYDADCLFTDYKLFLFLFGGVLNSGLITGTVS